MKEVKNALGRIAVYYLLLAINIIPLNLIADIFPIRNLSTIYLLILSVCFVLYNFHRVSPTGGLSVLMKLLSLMALLLILLRGVKYGVVSEVGVLARHTWYLYYLPILLIPSFLFCISLLVSAKDTTRIPKTGWVVLALTGVLILLVLTNDLHRQAFVFNPGFEDWDGNYTYGWLFYAVIVWQFLLSLAAIVILLVKCRVSTAKRSAWIILIPFVIGAVLYGLLLTDAMPRINDGYIVEFPEAHIFTAATILECCMQLGLIPTNDDYGKVFNRLSISAQITDRGGVPVYASASATPLRAEYVAAESGTRIGEHTVLHKMEIPGGFGFWQVDVSGLDRLNDELAEAKEGLAEEAELIRLRNELKEKQTVIRQRTLVYDAIAKGTQRHARAILQFAEQARVSADPAEKDALRRRIVLLGAYIKRYANLMLLAQESDTIAAGELGLSFSEVLRCLNYCGIPGEFVGGADRTVRSAQALAVFEIFETLIESSYSTLAGVFVNLSANRKVIVKITFENLTAPLPDGMETELSAAGVGCEIQREDGITYLCLTMEGGAV